MIAFAHHEREPARQRGRSPQGSAARKSAAVMHRHSRLNPITFLAAVSAALLFDAISSVAGQRIWTELLSSLDAMPPLAVVAGVLVLVSLAYLIIKIAISRFARSRGVQDATRAKD